MAALIVLLVVAVFVLIVLARTIRIAMRAGQDSDCNPSNAASVLGTWLGRDRIPARFRHGIAFDRPFPYTGYTLRDAIETSYELAGAMAVSRGGQVSADTWSLQPSPITPAPSARSVSSRAAIR